MIQNTCVDEQVQVTKNSKHMVFKALPRAGRLPYVAPEMLPKHHREAPLSHNYRTSNSSALARITPLRSHLTESPSNTETQGTSVSFNQSSSAYKIPSKSSTNKNSDPIARLPVTIPPQAGNDTESDRATKKEEKVDIKETTKAKDNNAPTLKEQGQLRVEV